MGPNKLAEFKRNVVEWWVENPEKRWAAIFLLLVSVGAMVGFVLLAIWAFHVDIVGFIVCASLLGVSVLVLFVMVAIETLKGY